MNSFKFNRFSCVHLSPYHPRQIDVKELLVHDLNKTGAVYAVF